MYDLDGKIAIVTGAAGRRGFGRAIANRLAKEGSYVVIVDKYAVPPRDGEAVEGWRGLDSVLEEMRVFGRQSLAMTCDIAQSGEVDAMVKEISDKFGSIDILVNNAGVHIWGNTNADWHSNISVNLTGAFYCIRAVSQTMIRRNRGGKIINISSSQGKEGRGQGDVGYVASKFGMVGMTQDLALEMAPYRINVNAVCPGGASTDIGSEHIKSVAQSQGISVQEAKERWLSARIASIPLGRIAEPQDIANMVAFLASSEADFITGQSINVNGGLLTAH